MHCNELLYILWLCSCSSPSLPKEKLKTKTRVINPHSCSLWSVRILNQFLSLELSCFSETYLGQERQKSRIHAPLSSWCSTMTPDGTLVFFPGVLNETWPQDETSFWISLHFLVLSHSVVVLRINFEHQGIFTVTPFLVN